ncbi:DUF3298 and DUF4163 domain-containing protein [Butyrivibrio sp. WCD3002]|uniref:DUF3298 and DUF4163 domain-containing protein n=1 Tax=Butyrivibrio sp. WCD3002 TaxID=1280676 RepID=UPI000411AE10|nr:DUF3298 and DUF4163 domain-containing protein [Butyrivibrio sp. WCD3002]
MKKELALLLCTSLTAASLSGCGMIGKLTGSSTDTDAGSENSNFVNKIKDGLSEESGETSEVTDEAVTKEAEAETSSDADDQQENEITDDTAADENKAPSESEHKTPTYKIAKKYFTAVYDGDLKFSNPENDYSQGVLISAQDAYIVMDESYEKDYPELYKALKERATVKADSGYDNWVAEAKATYEDAIANDYGFFGPWTSTQNYYLTRSDETVLSIYDYSSDYEGGAHGMYGAVGINYDVQTGKELTLGDVVQYSKEELDKIIKEKLYEIPDSADAYWELDETLANYKFDPSEADDGYSYKWYLSNDGLHIIFNPYEVAAYAYGMIEVSIGYNEYDGLINEKFIPEEGRGFISHSDLSLCNAKWADDIKVLHLEFEGSEDNEYGDYAENLSLVDGDKRATVPASFEVDYERTASYNVKTDDGREYIYVTVPDYNDYYMLFVFDISGNEFKATEPEYFHYAGEDFGNDYFGEALLSDPDNMPFAIVSDCFGTMNIYNSYKVGDDGRPVPTETVYTVGSYCSPDAKSNRDIKGDIVDEAGNVISSGEIIKSGESFEPIRTDNKSFVDCRLGDGRIVRLTLKSASYPVSIQEGELTEVFDNIVYAG